MSRFLVALLLLLAVPAYADEAVKPVPAVAMYGDLKYGPDFKNFDYVNPDAPKGGTLRLSAVDSYDSFNPYIVGSVAESSIGLIYVTLTEQSADEAFSEYGAIAESIEMPKDRSWIVFNLRPEARWDDGQPITAEDVKWSFDTIVKDGLPFYHAIFSDVTKVEILSDKRIKFSFSNTGNRQAPLMIGSSLPILPKHFWTAKGNDFTKVNMAKPLGNGPYRIKSFDPQRSVTYERVKDWWGANLPAFKGRYNYDTVTVTYFRDPTVELEALFGGSYDIRYENAAKNWAQSYNTPQVADGRIIKKEIPNGLPQGMQAFVYNLRRPVFQNQAVRKALDYAFDFEASNRLVAFSAYKRNSSFFENSPMAAPHHPPEGKVKDILTQFKDQLPPDIFTTRYEPPKTDGSGNNRDNLRTAIKILDDAGFKPGPDGVRIDPKTHKPLQFEFLTDSTNAMFNRWIIPFIDNLKKIGVGATFRAVDSTQYVERVEKFDFDMTVTTFRQSLVPGPEQRDMWTSAAADRTASSNLIGLKSPIIDKLVEAIISAPTEQDMIDNAQALDYVLLNGNYVIPNWFISSWRLAWWNKFGQPEKQAPYAPGYVDAWWVKK